MAELNIPAQADGANPFSNVDHKQLDKYFNQLRRDIRKERATAQNTLSPGQIRNAIRAGKIPPQMEVLIGAKEDGSAFTLDDLQAFDKARKRAASVYGKGITGAPIMQLVAASKAIDVERANTEIKASRLYRVRGNLLTFNVTASKKYDADWHQVRVRIEHWHHALTSSKSPQLAVKKALQGPVSFDCDCGRHQYWYRYLATVGGFCLTPMEKDFPKVRNPNLSGCCCKHVLKTFKAVMSPTVHNVLTREMKRQAESVGFASDSKTQFLTKKEQKELEKARPGQVNQDQAKANWETFKKAQQKFMAQIDGKDGKDSLRKATQKKKEALRRRAAELAKGEKQLKKEQAQLERERKKLARDQKKAAQLAAQKHKATKAVRRKKPSGTDALSKQLRQQIEFSRMYDIPLTTVYAKFADQNNLSASQVQKMAKEL